MSVKMRQEIERKIATAVVDAALKAGYSLNIDNGGEEFELSDFSTNKKQILSTMFQTDQEHLHLAKGNSRVGWVFFVYGNDGWDVINDYTTNLESIMTKANEIADYYAG